MLLKLHELCYASRRAEDESCLETNCSFPQDPSRTRIKKLNIYYTDKYVCEVEGSHEVESTLGDALVRRGTRSIENAHKNPAEIDKWIQSINDLHRTKPPPQVIDVGESDACSCSAPCTLPYSGYARTVSCQGWLEVELFLNRRA